MQVRTLLESEGVSVRDFRCTAGPADRPFAEQHDTFSLSYVLKGSFGCRAGGRHYELVPGSLFIGYPGDEFVCLHEHHASGDECLSFSFTSELVDTLCALPEVWRIVAVPPLTELIVLGERARAARDGRSAMRLDEAGTLLAIQFAECISKKSLVSSSNSARDRRRAVELALWIEESAHEPIDLDTASTRVGLSKFHLLRVFRSVFGVTPHQYLIRCRLRRAVELLADDQLSITAVAFEAGFGDLTNFIRTFRQATRFAPGKFRQELVTPKKKGDRAVLLS